MVPNRPRWTWSTAKSPTPSWSSCTPAARAKKTWVIVIGEGCHRDKPSDRLDLPREAGHPDPASYQAERRRLQQDYIGRLTRENHLRYTANNDTELQNIVLRLRDELGELRRGAERQVAPASPPPLSPFSSA